MINTLVLVKSDCYLTLNVFSILKSHKINSKNGTYHEHRCLISVALFVLDGSVFTIVNLLYLDIDFTRGRKAK